MPFAYFRRLTRAQQKVYRQSDEVAAVRLPGAQDLRPLVDALDVALENGHLRAAVRVFDTTEPAQSLRKLGFVK